MPLQTKPHVHKMGPTPISTFLQNGSNCAYSLTEKEKEEQEQMYAHVKTVASTIYDIISGDDI